MPTPSKQKNQKKCDDNSSDSEIDADLKLSSTSKRLKKSTKDIIGHDFASDSDSDSEVAAIKVPQQQQSSTTRKRNTSNQSFPLNTNSSSSALNVCHEVNVNNGVSRSQRTRKKSEKQLQYEEYKNNEEHISHIQKSARNSYMKQKSDKQKERRKVERANRSTNLHSNRIRVNGLFNTLASEWTKECLWCGYIHLNSATKNMRANCCYNGKLSPLADTPMYRRYAHLEPLSEQMRKLMIDDIEHFGRLSSAYNNMLSISRVGVENGKREAGVPNTHPGGFERRVGDHASIVCGRTYHCMPGLCNSLTPSSGAEYMMFDINAQIAIQNHVDKFNSFSDNDKMHIDPNTVLFLRDELLRTNKYCKELNFIGNSIMNMNVSSTGEEEETNDNNEFVKIYDARISLRNKVEYFDVAHITSDRASGSKILTLSVKGGGTRYIDMDSRYVEPLSYPIIFQHGEPGWGVADQEFIPCNKQIASHLLRPEIIGVDPYNRGPLYMTAPQKDAVFVEIDNDQCYSCELRVNRFQLCSRVMNVYCCDMWSRVTDRRLNFVIRNQDAFKMGQKWKSKFDDADDEDDEDDEDDYDSDGEEFNDDVFVNAEQRQKEIFLPSSFHGSPRHRKKLSLNALSIVTKLGKPTLFITGTVNVNWPEIQSRLLKGQTAFDRGDVVMQVFHMRLAKFIHNLKHGKYFGRRKAVYILYVIEYQWRGLPHFHLAVRLEDLNYGDNLDNAMQFVDEYIKAEIPSEANIINMSPERLEQYRKLVKQHMLHKCATAVNGCKKTDQSLCKRGYDNTKTIPVSFIDDKGYVVYRRRSVEDLKVVPHNPDCLLDWDGHMNVEFSDTVNHILYMFSYLYKGPNKQSVNIEGTDKFENEISLFLKGNVICSMDAINRILGFHTYPKPSPAVKTIKVKLPDEYEYLSKQKGLSSDILIYFSRPIQLKDLKYTEFFNNFIVYKYLPPRFKNKEELLDKDYFIFRVHNTNNQLYLCKRVDPSKCIVRMEMNYINHGEIFYFRLILLKRAVRDADDARLDPAGRKHKTFQQSAMAHGYIRNLEDTTEQFVEFASMSTPRQLRGHFALMMTNGFPMWHIYDNKVHRKHLMQDYLDLGQREPIALNSLLQDLERILVREGSSLSNYGFDMPEGMETELEIAKLMYQEKEQMELLRKLEEDQPNNIEQQQVFDHITADIESFISLDEVDKEDNVFHFLGGPGGTGKTAVFKKLQAWCRSQGILISCCAATTLAALLFENAKTAHSLFNYPVVDELDIDNEAIPECNIKQERLELLLETQVIFWDEFVSNDRALMEAVIRCLTHRYKKRFIFICAGDFRQILPVVRFGLKHEVINACISSSPYWSKFKVFQLKENMRLQGLQKSLDENSSDEQKIYIEKQKQYASFLMDLSANKESESLNILHQVDEDTCKIGLRDLDYFTSEKIDDAINWIYPNGKFDASIALQSVILASTNDAVDGWNSKIQSMNKNQSRKYTSRDMFCEVDDEDNILKNVLTDDVLNRYNRNGVPTHELEFKPDDVCIVVRAIPALELATNTRIQVVRCEKHCVVAKTLNEPVERYVLIPRITFKFRLQYGESYQLTRVQLPLRLAYAMTYNKSQSQTLKQVLVDCTGEPFAHGHAYVAFSRVRDCDNIRVYVNPDQLHEKGDGSGYIPCISNIVYKEILM